MPIELWFHHEASAFVRKPLLVACELELELVEVRVDFQSEEALADYARLNPNRKFPALRHDELVLWESNAIMAYLATLHGPQLLGGGPAGTARVQQWLFWELAHFGPAILGLSNLRLGFLPKPPLSAEALEQQLAKLLRILDGALDASPYLAGDEISLADLALAADFTFAKEADVPLDGHTKLAAWLRGIEERESWRTTDRRKEAVLRAAGIK